MVPAGGGGAEAAKLIPTHRMQAGSEVDAREHRVRLESQDLWRDVPERGNSRGLRKLCHDVSGACEIACECNHCLDGATRQYPFARAQRLGVAIQLEIGIGQYKPVNDIQREE